MKSSIATLLTAFVGVLSILSSADARPIVQVDIYGVVGFNGITTGPLGTVTAGQTAHTSFQLDSSVFVDSIPGDVRAYDIIAASYALSFSGGASVGLAAGPAYFGVRDGDPGVDGFFVSDNTTSFGGVALSQTPYRQDFHATYSGTTLGSLDILAAVGTYNFTGLTVFGYNLWQVFPDNVKMDIDFDHMTISQVPGPATLFAFAPLAIGMHRRRRR